MQQYSSMLFFLLVANLLLVFPTVGVAHELEPTRAVIAEISHDYVDIMVIYNEPSGPRTSLILRRFDINADNRINGHEVPLAAREFMPQLFHGLEFEVESEKPRMGTPEVKFDTGDDGEISVGAFMRYELTPIKEGQQRKFIVRLKEATDILPVEVVMRSSKSMRLFYTTLPTASHAETAPFTIRSGQEINAIFSRVE